jgi:hypothetical protein
MRGFSAFALYGIVTEIITYMDSQSYEQDVWANLSIITNIPTAMAFFMILGENFHVPVPTPIWNAIIVLGSMLVWSIIGFNFYCFVKLFKMG